VPTGALHFLPLHAARCIDPNGERHLVDDFVVRIAPSAGILAMLQAEQARLDLGAVVAGVSQYNNPGLAPLPGVEAETRAIAETLGAKPLLNEAANAETLAGALREAAFVHLACHGAQWAEDPQFGKHFAPQAVLHLANEGLTFADILVNWDLGRTRLITLSACDTGLIDAAKPWDELEGLRHVLLQSGAQAIVASLWSVDDESTALLMRRFYRNIRDREMAIPEALSESQRWLRDATHAELAASHVGIYNLNSGAAPDERPYRHPYFWGPFFFTG
jgi:CHAT domain-containing protein